MGSRYSNHSGQIWKSNLSKHGFQSAYGSQIMCVTIGYHIGAFRHVKSTHRTRLSRDKKRDKFVTGDFAFLSQCNNCGMDRIRLKRCTKTLCIMGNQYWVLASWYTQVLLPWQIRWQIRWQICHRRIGRPDLGLLRVEDSKMHHIYTKVSVGNLLDQSCAHDKALNAKTHFCHRFWPPRLQIASDRPLRWKIFLQNLIWFWKLRLPACQNIKH